jgi:hypothetical protein
MAQIAERRDSVVRWLRCCVRRWLDRKQIQRHSLSTFTYPGRWHRSRGTYPTERSRCPSCRPGTDKLPGSIRSLLGEAPSIRRAFYPSLTLGVTIPMRSGENRLRGNDANEDRRAVVRFDFVQWRWTCH